MESLVRTRVERFLIKDSLRLEEIERLKKEVKFLEAVIPVDEMFTSYKAAVVKGPLDGACQKWKCPSVSGGDGERRGLLPRSGEDPSIR